MKKIIAIIILILVAVGGIVYWPQIRALYFKAGLLAKTVSNNSTVVELKKEVSAPPPLKFLQGVANAHLTQAGVITLTNAQRQQNGQPSLKENIQLDQAAEMKLQDMFKNQYFEHISPSGVGPGDLAKQVNYNYISVGENLALGNFADDQALVTAWMNSPGHRANILDSKYMEIGVAVGKGTFQGQTTWLAVQEFGRPASSCPVIQADLKTSIDNLNLQVASELTEIKAKKVELDSMPLKTQADYNAYNEQAAVFNNLVNAYNNDVSRLKQTIDQYNLEVQSYNSCAG